MTTTLTSTAITLATLLLIYRIAFSRKVRWHPFNPRRANLTTRRPTGGNALLLLAGVNLAALTYQIITETAATHTHLLTTAVETLLPILLITAITMLVITRNLADLTIGLTGITATLTDAYLQNGTPGVLAILTLTLITLFLLGTIRGLLTPRH